MIVLYIPGKKKDTKEILDFLISYDSIQSSFNKKAEVQLIIIWEAFTQMSFNFSGNKRHLLISLTIYTSSRLKVMMWFHLYPNLNKTTRHVPLHKSLGKTWLLSLLGSLSQYLYYCNYQLWQGFSLYI